MVENGRAGADQGVAPFTLPPIREALAGKRILLTGVTGFLGTALLERLLTDVPDSKLVLMVRGRFGSSPESRVRELLGRPAFEAFREAGGPGAADLALAERLEIVEGDVSGEPPAMPGDLDLVFHCAASVSFDPPIDQAFQTNVLGAVRLYEAVLASGSRPHLVHVSTAYVAGSTKGVVREAPLEHRVNWRTEAGAAMAARQTVEDASRKPEMLDGFMARAHKEHRRAGPMAVARDAEERRQQWVDKRLIQYGRARAQSLGWPDVYTFTKALGERAVEQLAEREANPLSIVRPSIIESALERPSPGWIEGFKMAEPIILAYGRGAIPEFPAIPDGIMDIIPVDLVVNAMMAVAARTPEDGPEYYHVCSGSRNPLTFRTLYENVRQYFERHPLPERGRGEVRVPSWKFPGRRKVEARLRTGEKLLDGVDGVVSRLPRSPRVRNVVRQLDRERGRLEFVRRYADLYGAYTEIEVIYTDHRTLALHRALDPSDRDRMGFDSTVYTWRHYLQEVHCPAVTLAMRFPSAGRPEPEVRVRPSENGVLAVFDMEGTLLDSNVVESYLWLRMAELPEEEWPSQIAAVARRLPSYLKAERRDRGEFLRSFYRRYRGASEEGLRRLMQEHVGELLLRRLSAEAVRRIREHRAAGHRTVLITGALECFAEPLRPLFDLVVATRLAVRDGRFTGDLAQPPLVGEARAAWLKQYALAEGADLKRSYGYADSHSDLPLLRAVGHPVAVNPDVALYRVARKRRWPIEEWSKARGTPRVLIPERVG
jgi:alcohol-forming fatty acyl-CoA reductase